MPPAPESMPVNRTRLRRKMLILASILTAGGLVVLLFLDRIPLPLRLAVGLSDLIGAAVLFVVVRQKFGAPPTAG
jgi:hypothetical protein